jgi:hypothetical protein
MYNFFFIGNKRNNINKRKGALKHIKSIQGHQNKKRTHEKTQKTEEKLH